MFISFEGGDGAGKSTQARQLQRRLVALGHRVTLLAEPGGTPLGQRLRRLLKFSGIPIASESEALLFLASRAQLVRERIRPALARDEVVICDRYADSTLAYQGYGRGLDLEQLRRLNELATGGLSPALTVLLDLPVEEARRRRRQAGDRIEKEGAGEPGTRSTFHSRVRQGYLALARREPERWLVVDATRARKEVSALVWSRVHPLLEARSR